MAHTARLKVAVEARLVVSDATRDALIALGWTPPADEQPETATACKRCKGTRKVPDWANWNEPYGEPYPKPCPDCTEESATTP